MTGVQTCALPISVPKKLGSSGFDSVDNFCTITEIKSRGHEFAGGDNDFTGYNWISQFDLRDVLGPDYASKRILDDFYVFPATIQDRQGHTEDNAEKYMTMLMSPNSWNNIKSSDLPGVDWWATTFPVKSFSGDHYSTTNIEMNYVYETGQLYVIWLVNYSIYNIRLFIK